MTSSNFLDLLGAHEDVVRVVDVVARLGLRLEDARSRVVVVGCPIPLRVLSVDHLSRLDGDPDGLVAKVGLRCSCSVWSCCSLVLFPRIP